MSTPLHARSGGLSFSIFDLVHYPYETDPAGFDPAAAGRVYDEHLEEWTEAERLGFDAIFLTEHHFTAYNLMPSPNVMLAALAARTEAIRLGTMINVVPFHQRCAWPRRARCSTSCRAGGWSSAWAVASTSKRS